MCVYVGLDRYSCRQKWEKASAKILTYSPKNNTSCLSWLLNTAGSHAMHTHNITILYVLFRRYINVLWALEKLCSILSSKLASIDWANPQIVEMIDVVGDRLT